MQSMEEMLKAATEAASRIQQQMNEAQVKLDALEVEGASGGGLVKVRATARGRILGVAIDDLPDGAGGQADPRRPRHRRLQRLPRQGRSRRQCARCRQMQGGLGLPPGFKLPGM